LALVANSNNCLRNTVTIEADAIAVLMENGEVDSYNNVVLMPMI
jgi:hypothetical protein